MDGMRSTATAAEGLINERKWYELIYIKYLADKVHKVIMIIKVVKLIGLFLLDCILESIYKTNHDLNRDDGLIVNRQASSLESERIRKKSINFFQEQGLQITSKINFTQTNYLDETLDLKSNRFSPFQKTNDKPLMSTHNQTTHQT